jgi:hypothetical protein
MREYIYISDAKLESLSHLLGESVLDRLRGLNVTIGPVGGGVALSDASAPTKHAVITEIEAAIKSARSVSEPTARHLVAGDWIEGLSMRLSFGIPSDSLEASAAVFVADLGDTDLVLSGSVRHLIGRTAGQGPVAQAMSAPAEIGRLLWMAADGVDVDPGHEILAQYAFHKLHRELSKWAPPQPVSFLARVTHVFDPNPRYGDDRVIAGSPLFVAYT